jgi:hypothetical protein
MGIYKHVPIIPKLPRHNKIAQTKYAHLTNNHLEGITHKRIGEAFNATIM